MNAGLCIQILFPDSWQVFAAGDELALLIQVALSCGCVPGAGGRYDYRQFEVKAALARDDGEPVTIVLLPGSDAGLFRGRATVHARGSYLLEIEAHDPETGMAGRARRHFHVK